MTHNLLRVVEKGLRSKMDQHTYARLKKIIDALCSEGKILRYYRPDLDLFIETDASRKDIGMALTAK